MSLNKKQNQKPNNCFFRLNQLILYLHIYLSGAYAGFHDGERVHGKTLKTD